MPRPSAQTGGVRLEPPPSVWTLPDPTTADDDDGLVGIGADLEPGTLLAAYRTGLFPMPLPAELRVSVGRDTAPVGWWSPDPRGVLPLDALQTSRSLRRSLRRYEVTFDTAFGRVVEACADPSRPHGWIDRSIVTAYGRLHQLGWAHSVEVWDRDDGELVGGLYGVAIGRFFAGESMFHRRTDASKAALVHLVERLRSENFTLLDVQWRTEHLASLGAVEMPRTEYLARLESAVRAMPEALRQTQRTL